MANTIALESAIQEPPEPHKRTTLRLPKASEVESKAPLSSQVSGDEILEADAIPMKDLTRRGGAEISPEDFKRSIRYYRTRMRELLRAKEVKAIPMLYTDTERIGAGAFGQVYKARDPITGQDVVLKLMNPLDADHEARIRKEARTIIALGREEGIIKGYLLKRIGSEGISGIPDAAGKFVLETEFIDGHNMDLLHRDFFDRIRSLQEEAREKKSAVAKTSFRKCDIPAEFVIFQYTKTDFSFLLSLTLPDHKHRAFSELSDEEPLTHREVELIVQALEKQYRLIMIGVFVQACRALQKAHDAGVLHRDMKPENMILTPGGELKIIDWGLVKSMERDEQDPKITFHDVKELATNISAIIGTPQYIPPENLDEKQAGSRNKRTIDVWSLGVTLTYLLTDIFPFLGPDKSPLLSMSRIVKDEMINRTAIEHALQDPMLFRILMRALQHDPKARFQSMNDFQDSMNYYLDLQSVTIE